MSLRIVTPATALAVTLEDARDHCGITADDGPEHDRLLTREIRAVTDWLTGPSGWLGRSLLTRTLDLTVPLGIIPAWSGGSEYGCIEGIALPWPPLVEVMSVTVQDANGETVIPTGSYYTVERYGVARLLFRDDFRWPILAEGPALLRIRFKAGYGDEPDDLDQGLAQAVLMTVARLHENRGDGVTGNLQTDPFIRDLFAPYRVF
jgi:uncharacterized phiE125 gp8 family phage protein